MFRARSSLILLLVGCGGAQRATPRCPADGIVVLALQDDIERIAVCEKLARVTIRTGVPLDLTPLARLVEITGDLVVGPTLQLEELKLPALRSVGGAITIQSNAILRGVFVPALEEAGSIDIVASAAATTVSAPRLTRVARTVTLADMGSLEIVDFSSLTTIGGELVITDNPVLALVELGKLSSVKAMRVERNRVLGELQTGSGGRDHDSMSHGQ